MVWLDRAHGGDAFRHPPWSRRLPKRIRENSVLCQAQRRRLRKSRRKDRGKSRRVLRYHHVLDGLGVLVVWLLGGQQVLGGKMTLGTLLAFYSYMWLFYGPLEWFGQVNSWMSRAFAGAERIFEVIDTQPEAYEDPTAKRVPRMKGGIRFEGVTFGYDKSKPVLKDFDLDIQPGEMIGLVGKSGVGKTTTVNLIARLLRHRLRSPLRSTGTDIPQNPPARLALADRHCAAGAGAFFRHHCRKHRLWSARLFLCGHYGGRSRSQRPQLHHGQARRLMRPKSGRKGPAFGRGSASASPLPAPFSTIRAS